MTVRLYRPTKRATGRLPRGNALQCAPSVECRTAAKRLPAWLQGQAWRMPDIARRQPEMQGKTLMSLLEMPKSQSHAWLLGRGACAKGYAPIAAYVTLEPATAITPVFASPSITAATSSSDSCFWK